jgi:hypothetical protein
MREEWNLTLHVAQKCHSLQFDYKRVKVKMQLNWGIICHGRNTIIMIIITASIIAHWCLHSNMFTRTYTIRSSAKLHTTLRNIAADYFIVTK